MKYACPACGFDCSQVTERLYTLPAQIRCPQCQECFRDPDCDGVKVLTKEEAMAKRPQLYKDEP